MPTDGRTKKRSSRAPVVVVAAKPRRKWKRWAVFVVLDLLIVAFVTVWISTDEFRALGGAPYGEYQAHIARSPNFRGGRFQNLEPTKLWNMSSLGPWLKEMFGGNQLRRPTCALPLYPSTRAALSTAPASGLRITWLGHSTTLIEIDGVRVLTDPIWSERPSPISWVGPQRFHPPVIALADLPRVDGVLVSHEHFDHLDMATVKTLARTGVVFHVPLGVGPHLAVWGVPAAQIHEHDWWEEHEIARGVRLVSTPSRHFNGRGAFWREGSSWTSWALVGPAHRVYFSGDTGLTETFREIGRRYGPFDVSLLEIGQFHPSWSSIHLGPHGALDAHAMLGARAMIPIHWATFELAFHAWSEPAETLVTEAARRSVSVLTPMLGQPIEPTTAATTPWWRPYPPMTAGCPRP